MSFKKGNIYQPSRGPPTPRCQETDASWKIGGPIYLHPIHDIQIVQKAIHILEDKSSHFPHISTKTPIHGLLTAVSEELSDVPLYYNLSDLCHTLHCQVPSQKQVFHAIINGGYRVSAQHKEPMAIKTDAPPPFLWDVLRSWVKLHPVHSKWITGKNENSAAAKILSKDIDKSHIIDWSRPKSCKIMEKKKAQRYPMNPEPNWGPKPRAVGKRTFEDSSSYKSEKKIKEDDHNQETMGDKTNQDSCVTNTNLREKSMQEKKSKEENDISPESVNP